MQQPKTDRAPDVRLQIERVQEAIDRHAQTFAEAIGEGCVRCADQALRQIRRLRERMNALHGEMVCGAEVVVNRLD